MDTNSPPIAPAAADVLTPDFLETLSERVLLLPRMLESCDGQASLNAKVGPHGEPYHQVRLFSPTSLLGHGKELFFYMGRLSNEELDVVRAFIDEHCHKHPGSGPKILRGLQAEFKAISELWAEARETARYAATLAGYTMRDYRLHRSRKEPPAAMPSLAPPVFSAPLDFNGGAFYAGVRMILQSMRSRADSEPLKTTHAAFDMMRMLGGVEAEKRFQALAYSFQEFRRTLIAGKACRPLKKIERRAIIRQIKLERILPTIDQSLDQLATEILRRSTQNEDR